MKERGLSRIGERNKSNWDTKLMKPFPARHSGVSIVFKIVLTLGQNG